MLDVVRDEMDQGEFMTKYSELVINNFKLNKYKMEKKKNITAIEGILDKHVAEVEARKKTK